MYCFGYKHARCEFEENIHLNNVILNEIWDVVMDWW